MTETEKGGVDFGFVGDYRPVTDDEIRYLGMPGRLWSNDEAYPLTMRAFARLRDEMRRADEAEAKLAKVDEIARRKVTLGDVVENVSWLVAIVHEQDKAAEEVWGHAAGLHTWADTLRELKHRAESAEEERDALRQQVDLAQARLAVAAEERDELRAEVERLRKELDREQQRAEHHMGKARLARLEQADDDTVQAYRKVIADLTRVVGDD